MKILYLISFLLIVQLPFLKATNPDKYSEYKFSKLTKKDGLPHNHIECIIKDSEGFMWFGTRSGLTRFDGYNFKSYWSTNDSASLSGNRIQCLAEDYNGNLWIGTYNNGLNIYHRKKEKFERVEVSGILNGRINNIKILSDSSIWVCTNAGVIVFKNTLKKHKVFRHDPGNDSSINSDLVHDVIETSNQEIYLATEANYIVKFAPDSETFSEIKYARTPELNVNYRKKIIEDNNGILWITANVHGLCSYNPANGKSEIYTARDGLSSNVLNGSAGIDSDGNIWICTDGGGISIFNPDTREFSSIQAESDNEWALSSNHIYTVYFDNLGITWLGTFESGVSYYDPQRFKFTPTLLKTGDLLMFKGKSVLSLYQDSKKRIWIGTDGDGLYMINTAGEITEYHHIPNSFNSLSTEVITTISEDPRGNILLGTYSGGFMILNPDTKQITRIYQGDFNLNQLASSSVWHILRDSEERIWLGLLGTGVDLYDSETRTFENYGPPSKYTNKKIDFPNIMTIMETSEGDLWFGTEGKGIFILDKQAEKTLQLPGDNTQNITISGVIKALYEDKWQQVWIGTEGKGLFKYDIRNQSFSNFNVNDGLPSNIIQSITEDINGNLWLGTSDGLAVFNTNTLSIRTYLDSDGLSGNDFNMNALLKLDNGNILAGSSDGLDLIIPENLQSNLILPRIVLTSLKILNREIHPGEEINGRIILEESISNTEEITLTHKEKTISVEFSALHYTLPDKCQYSYKLQGFDDDWVVVNSNNRHANYTNLSAGSYNLLIKASNNDGKWGNNIRQLRINVLPPFYNTLWFKSIVGAFVLLLIVSAYRYRLNAIRNKFLEKQYEQDKRILALENEKLESELQKLTFHVLNRNRELIDQKNRLLGLSMKAKESVRMGLQDIITKFDEELNDDKDWKYIEPQLDKVYNNFVTRLKELHPDLSLSEVKIAAYVRMNLSTKEISEFMHKTTRAIENDRYRLRKKIGIDKNDSLKDYLNSL
jgi:ligand-binding sensor domain-containing protein/DNA-binding CsgD family transcriptional regulator